MIKLGIVGLGRWGSNYYRIFSQMENVKITCLCDNDSSKFKSFMHKDIKFYTEYKEMAKKENIDACIIAVPTIFHYSVAKEFLSSGTHVLIEKPIATSTKDAEKLVEIALKKNLKLMVGHTFLFNPGINWLKKYIKTKDFGKIYYFYAVRTNLGPIRDDVNAIVDLAPHDISIFLYLLEKMPVSVFAQGSAYLSKKRIDTGVIGIYFDNGESGFVHVSWLEPCKIRQVTAIGSKKMVVFDDVNTQEMIKIYDKSVKVDKTYSDFGEFKMILRDGDIVIPKIKMVEPLKAQCMHFIECLLSNKKMISDGEFGVNVVKVLSAAEKSLLNKGQVTKVE